MNSLTGKIRKTETIALDENWCSEESGHERKEWLKRIKRENIFGS